MRAPRACVGLVSLLLACASLTGLAHAEGRCGTHPWCDTHLSPDARAALLLAAMSEADKVGILTGQAAPDVGLPAIKFTDGALGAGGAGSNSHPATAMPAGIALAANFSQAMARRYGSVVGAEVRDRGFDGDWGPTVNIMRTPLGGRTYEGFGEDPFLDAQTAVGWIDGFQSQGVMADVKHFAANNQEGQIGVSPVSGVIGGRLIDDVDVDPRVLHEIEFPAFQAAVQQAHVATVMCSYNMINGVYACADPWLLQSTLRNSWGFGGFVFSDAGACHEPNADMAAGLDFDILDTCYSSEELDPLLATGLITQQTLNARVLDILRTLFRFGFFDHSSWPSFDLGADHPAADEAVSDAAAEGGAVLLENHGVLPIQPRSVGSIAVIGPAAAQYIHGNGSSQVTPYLTTDVLQGIEARAAQSHISVTYNDGANVQSAQTAAKHASLAIVVAADTESEGEDKVCMSLVPQCSGGQSTPPDAQATQLDFGDQDSLISAVAAANPKTVVVLETGAPVLTPWRQSLAGLLEAWYPGEDGGTAIAHVLFGDVDPGGRLPATFPQQASDIPTAAGGAAAYPGIIEPQSSNCDVDTLAAPCPFYQTTYSEGVFVGYRSYQERHITPAFPFGFGLSYTTFRFGKLKIKSAADASAQVSATVTNTGKRAGWAVPELYVGLPSLPGVPEPPEQLKGFTKLLLTPGQSKRVTFALNPSSFSYWSDAKNAWEIAPGCDRISVGSSSQDLPLSGVIGQHGAACQSPRPGCPVATGRLRGNTLGLVTLGMTRERARRAFTHSSDRGRRYEDFFCLTPNGVRVGYASPRLLATLPRRERARLAGRVVWASTANRFYSLRGIRPGATLTAARRKLRTGGPFHVGLNYWYFAPDGSSRALLKVRHGLVQEIGIANKVLTNSRKAQHALITSFTPRP